MLDEVLEEVEQREIRPVQVFDDEHRRNALGDRLEERAPGGERLGALDQRCRLEADERQQALLQPRSLVTVGKHRSELVPGDLWRVALEDARVRLDDLAERPERDSVAVRETASLPPADELRATVHVAQKLGDLSRLADARLSDDGDELHRAVANSPVEEPGEERSLDVATDERGRVRPDDVAPETRDGSERPSNRDGRALPLGVDRLEFVPLEDPLRRSIRVLADRDAVDGRRGLDASGGVDDVAGHDSLALLGAGVQRDERLARVDADPHLERERRIGGVELVERLENRQPGPNGALGVVLVRNGSAEDGHDRVSDELLDDAAIRLDAVAKKVVVGPQPGADVLGIRALRSRREPDEVAEEHGDDLPLLPHRDGCAGELGTARIAESRAVAILRPARRAGRHALDPTVLQREHVDGEELAVDSLRVQRDRVVLLREAVECRDRAGRRLTVDRERPLAVDHGEVDLVSLEAAELDDADGLRDRRPRVAVRPPRSGAIRR